MARTYKFPEIITSRSDTGSYFGFNYDNGLLRDPFVSSSDGQVYPLLVLRYSIPHLEGGRFLMWNENCK